MRTFLVLCFFLLHVTSSFARPVRHITSEADVPRLLFVFGDSYADTGNTPNTSTAWHLPYGMSWPGSPSGRFCNGLIKTDFLASAVGIPSPTPYFQLSSNASITGGVNFAVGGSGATDAYGVPKLEKQVEWFDLLVNQGFFTEEVLNRALVFVSVAGNDYAAYSGSDLAGYYNLTHEVPYLIDQNLRTLYSLGARNFMVASVAPLSCLPSRTAISGFAECEKNSTIDDLIATHNYLLGNRLKNITNNLANSSVLYLQQTEAMKYVLDNLSEFNLTVGLKPCCVGKCSAVDETGSPLYTLCDNPDEHFFWDGIHPTQAGWKAVVDLYTNHYDFTTVARSLKDWLESLGS